MNSFDIVSHSDFNFYVIDDLKKVGSPKTLFKSLNDALGKFRSMDSKLDAMPALGVENGLYCLDFIHRLNETNVLVRDYKNENLSKRMKKMLPVLDKISTYLCDEACVTHTYCHDFFDRIGRSCPVVVPLSKKVDDFDNTYCGDKRLKTISEFGFDSINQLLIEGHGWVDYRDIRDESIGYADNGILYVNGVNVNYVLKNNMVGVDGQMDISPHDFSRMLKDVNKEFCLRVLDSRLGNSYIVASYDTLAEAVRAWYDLPVELTAYVDQRVGYSYHHTVFNGIGEDFEEIPYEKAAVLYGFAPGNVEQLIANATTKSADAMLSNANRFEREIEKE